MILNIVLLVMLTSLILFGCAEIQTPTPKYALTHPLGTKTMVTQGTPKGEVIEKWGEPDRIIEMGEDDMGIRKEAWIYEAWFQNAPLDYRHFSRKKKIYFTGDYVTGFEDIEDTEEVEEAQD